MYKNKLPSSTVEDEEAAINVRRGTYYNSEQPNIIDNYNLLANSERSEYPGEQLRVIVSDYRLFHDEIEYVLKA